MVRAARFGSGLGSLVVPVPVPLPLPAPLPVPVPVPEPDPGSPVPVPVPDPLPPPLGAPPRQPLNATAPAIATRFWMMFLRMVGPRSRLLFQVDPVRDGRLEGGEGVHLPRMAVRHRRVRLTKQQR